MKPLFTIITVCYNSEKSIEKTIQSVLNQTYMNYEYLIIDGDSTDGTVEIIKSYIHNFRGRMYLVSEKDEGWYDAMNKGIRLSEGHFIVFINSDDYFADDALRIVAEYIEKNNINDGSIVYGDSTNIYMSNAGEYLHRRIRAPRNINFTMSSLKNGMCGIRHQSMFTGRRVFEQVGELNLNYRLHADWDFMIKTLKAGIPYYCIGENLSFYSMYGQSTNACYEERHRVRKDNHLYKNVDWNYFKDRFGIKTILKKVLGVKWWNTFLFKYHALRIR